jgi:uncharacterized protein (TIGR02996 family)
MRDVLEAALRAHPHDPQVHAVYADWLLQQGDPRGELIRTQLQLEDEALSPAVRAQLRHREQALLAEHAAAWLGPLHAPMMASRQVRRWETPGSFQFRWGLPDLAPELVPALVAATGQVRTLRRFHVHHVHEDVAQLHTLEEVPSFPALELFEVNGTHAHGAGIGRALQRMPALQELHFLALRADGEEIFAAQLPRLRVLRVHYLHELPLEALARNPSLGSLEVLELEPHALEPGDEPYLTLASLQALATAPLRRLRSLALRQCSAGDEGLRVLIESPLLEQLEHLDLSYGPITDEGAQLLARALHERRGRLRSLCLACNQLTERGQDLLRVFGLELDLEEQFGAGNEELYLSYGSCE